MKNITYTILVILCLLSVIATPVQAGDILGPGDIAIIGYRFGSSAEFSFVCLKVISAGTEITFTDNGWKSNQTFRTGEGFISWIAPSGGCELGQVINIKKSDDPFTNISFDVNGDQIIGYQGSLLTPTLIFALNSYQDGWQDDATNTYSSSQPTVLKILNPSPSIAIQQTGYAIYSDTKRDFTSISEALTFVTDPANWTRSTSPLEMPTGDFSFTTTAVHLSDFSAETGGEFIPWWGFIIILIIPIAFFTVKKPKRDCCK